MTRVDISESQRRIVRFEQDDEDNWLAILDCNHSQHMRHRPPFEMREWVLSGEGRSGMIGTVIDCVYCKMPRLPENAHAYKKTPLFSQDSIPSALTHEHHTKAGVWGKVVVRSGRLRYQITDDRFLTGSKTDSWILRPGVDGVIAPEIRHKVDLVGAVSFYVEFLKLAP